MKTLTTQAKIGDFLKRIKRPIDLIDDKEYKLVTIKLHHNGVTLRETKKGGEIKSKMYEVRAGDFILSGIDARNGAFGIVPEELDGAIVTNDFWYFDIDEKIIDKHFFLELTATEWFDEICKKGSDGTTQRIRLQKDKFFNQTINLPDRSEQDKLLTVFKSRKKLTEKLGAKLINNLELIPLLRQQILQDAITGKLSEKWRKENPNIESAELLIEKIKAEKEKLVKEGKIRKQKPLPPISEKEIPFELPKGWVWCRFQDITTVITCGIASTPKYKEAGRIFLSAKNVKPYKFMPEEHKFVDEETYQKIILNSKPERDDILLTRVGAGIGEAAIIDQDIDFAFYVSLTLIKPVYKYIISEYILHFLNSPEGIKNAISYTTGKGGSQGNLNVNRVRPFLIPLPPIEEQIYISKHIKILQENFDRLQDIARQNIDIIGFLNQVFLKKLFQE